MILYGNAWFRTVAMRGEAFNERDCVFNSQHPAGTWGCCFGAFWVFFFFFFTWFLLPRLSYACMFFDVLQMFLELFQAVFVWHHTAPVYLLLITLLQKYVIFSRQNKDQISSAGHGGCVSPYLANMWIYIVPLCGKCQFISWFKQLKCYIIIFIFIKYCVFVFIGLFYRLEMLYAFLLLLKPH